MKIRIIAPLMAYAAVAIGLFWAHSAWSALIGFHLAILGSLLLARPGVPITSLFRANDIRWVALSILLCGSSGISLYFLWPHFGIASDLPAQLQSIGLNGSTWPAFIAYFAFFNPFIEEYFWRGYLGSAARGFYIYDAIYSGYHLLILIGKVYFASIVFACALLTLAGWFWRQITREGHGLLPAVLGHMTADLTILLTVCWMSS